ncbi:MAG: class A beta-lactamase [Sphingomonadales bacterium]|nr:class A beta-lactamase [Sphingomonadales bacterium]MDE2171041.1 class A beta-lactamase [Sphingomonadales bacterium]
MDRRNFIVGGTALAALQGSTSHAATPPSAVLAYEAASGGQAGLYAQNLRTGARLAWRADQKFAMCSTFKASLAALILHRVDKGQERLDRPVSFTRAQVPDWWAPVAKANLARGVLSVGDMCAAIVEQSDNSCANLLLESVGGPQALTAFWRSIGDRETRLDDVEPALNKVAPGSVLNTTTPRAMSTILQHLILGPLLTQKARTQLRDWMIGCQTGANRLRAGLPSDWVIGDKTGNNGADAAGDIALVWPRPDDPIVICVYTRGGKPATEQLNALFAGLGRDVATMLG